MSFYNLTLEGLHCSPAVYSYVMKSNMLDNVYKKVRKNLCSMYQQEKNSFFFFSFLGLTESPVNTLKNSRTVQVLMDLLRKQIGVQYDEDDE